MNEPVTIGTLARAFLRIVLVIVLSPFLAFMGVIALVALLVDLAWPNLNLFDNRY